MMKKHTTTFRWRLPLPRPETPAATSAVIVVAVIALLVGLTLAGCSALDPDASGNLVPRTVDEDPSLPRIEVNGTMLHAEAFGRSRLIH